jgi:tRNA nucleotidyltransferase (CCA-adding enzyme)
MQAIYKWYELLYQGKPVDKVQYYLLGLVEHMKTEEVLEFCKKLEVTEKVRKKTTENTERLREVITRLSMGISVLKKSEIYRTLEPLSKEVMLFIMAKTRSEEIKKAISNYITYRDSFRPFTTGADLKKMGIQEGPVYKEILERLKDAKVDMNLKTKEEESHFVDIYLMEKGIMP